MLMTTRVGRFDFDDETPLSRAKLARDTMVSAILTSVAFNDSRVSLRHRDSGFAGTFDFGNNQAVRFSFSPNDDPKVIERAFDYADINP